MSDPFVSNLSAFDTLTPTPLRDKFRASVVVNEANKEATSREKDIAQLYSPLRRQMFTQARVLNGLLISPSTRDGHIGELVTTYTDKKKRN